jgi:hypothetical protein
MNTKRSASVVTQGRRGPGKNLPPHGKVAVSVRAVGADGNVRTVFGVLPEDDVPRLLYAVSAGAVQLRCDMGGGCHGPVTHVDDRGFLYCAAHGEKRKADTPCRKLRPAELKKLERGEPIDY